MKNRKLVLLPLLAVLALVIAISPVAAGGRPFVVWMSGENEAPGPGDPDGSGVARIEVNLGQREVCWWISVEDITLPATGAHIHDAPAGSPGPVVVPLSPPDESGTSSGCRTVEDKELLLNILTSPEEYYVNVHSTQFPAGAVRGQLR
jgi:hypothetical protein